MHRILLLLSLLPGGLAAQPPTGWKAGVAKTAITPTESIWMAGFGARTKPSEGVRQDIYVKALALQDETGKPSVLMTFDLVGLDRATVETLAARCRKQFGLSRDRLLLNFSHTHSGPVAGLQLMPIYDLDAGQRATIERYTSGLMEKAANTVGASIQGLAPATLDFGQGLAGFAVNRRRVRLRSLPGPVDHDLPVLRVRDANGNIRAIVAGYACHATSLSDYLINGDWPGFAQEEIEKAHPGSVALFVQGCGADSNPLPRGTVAMSRKYGEILAEATGQVLDGKMTRLEGPLRTALDLVDVPFQKAPGRDEWERRLEDQNKYRRQQARYLLDILARDGKLPGSYPYPVQVWRFGRGLKIVALGGETVVDYSLRLKAQHGWEDTWVAGYSNDIMAYIPSLRVLKEGGYEGGDAMVYFGRPAPFGAAVEEIIVEKVADLIQRTQP